MLGACEFKTSDTASGTYVKQRLPARDTFEKAISVKNIVPVNMRSEIE